MRLIDADWVKENCKYILDCEIEHPKIQVTLREIIDDAPTVDDVVSREEYDKLQHDYNELYDRTNGLLDRILGLSHL